MLLINIDFDQKWGKKETDETMPYNSASYIALQNEVYAITASRYSVHLEWVQYVQSGELGK